ncbi:MAG: hypothetical protein BroJett003_19270 [Planctomycetota bacterium]|nr:MAG: hypothetical protein BroJett003_19270 [Planctomycetota bacterium]
MNVLGIILARAGSKGLPGKCVLPLCGRALIEYTFDHALAARSLTAAVLSTDSEPAKALAHRYRIEVIDRPAVLATDEARVDDAARHAVEAWEARHGRTVHAVVLLYGNIPVRAPGLIDRVVAHLLHTGADSVRSVARVGKHHPDWLHRLDGDRMTPLRPNGIYRRQDLEPLYYHDGAAAAVTRASLFSALRRPDDGQAFLGADRRAVVQDASDAVDVDDALDLHVAEAALEGGTGESAADAVRIGERRVGAGHRVYVIAEAGVNHDGSEAAALELIDAAAEAGADAVKFQMFRADVLTARGAATAQYQRATIAARDQVELLESLELPDRAWANLRDRCRRRGVHFLATPFGIDEVRRVRELGAPAIKIASTDLTCAPLIDAACRTGLLVLLSTGAATAAEIDAAAARCRRAGAFDRLILMHCVSSYPTTCASANLRRISALQRRYRRPVGYSDHTTSVQTGAWAVAGGACVIEKHLTLDRGLAGPDHAASLDPAGFRAYVENLRTAESALGQGGLDYQLCEADVRRVARRSVVAAREIPAGTVLTADMLAFKRPGGGVQPSDFEKLLDRRLVATALRDTVLTWDMIE